MVLNSINIYTYRGTKKNKKKYQGPGNYSSLKNLITGVEDEEEKKGDSYNEKVLNKKMNCNISKTSKKLETDSNATQMEVVYSEMNDLREEVEQLKKAL